MEDLLQGKYRVLYEVGQGGMAVVYRGLDTVLDRDVAIKVLHKHLANKTDARERFQREAKAVAKLHHPNILEIYDYSGTESDDSFIVTEYIRGETLKSFIEREQPKLPEIGAMILHEVAAALTAAHESSIIHRDVKPENIMVRDDGVIKLMDFGIAQILDLQTMTVTGTLVGSPAHMSPEQVEGKALDYRADVFSAGTLLYYAATGALPFDATSPHALLKQICEVRYDDPRRHNQAISRRLCRIIERCLKKDAEERYPSMEALQQDLADYLTSVGLEDPATELAPYFDDPEEGEKELTERVARRLMERANTQANEGRVAAALEAYNQVLALRDDEDALYQVQRLTTARTRNANMRRLGFAVAALLVIALTGWLLIPSPKDDAPLAPRAVAVSPAASQEAPTERPERIARPEPPAPSPRAPIEEEVPIAVVAPRRTPALRVSRYARRLPDLRVPPRVEKVVASRKELIKRVGLDRKKGKERVKPLVHHASGGPHAKPYPGGIKFRLYTVPPSSTITIGGETFRGNTTQVRSPGTVSVVVSHPMCPAHCNSRTYTVRIDDKTPSNIRLEPAWKSATLLVRTDPSAHIRVMGRTVKSGRATEIKMRHPKERAWVRITAPGMQSYSRQVMLTAGRSTDLTVPLKPLPPEQLGPSK